MIPGALEPLPANRQTVIEPQGPRGPHLTPVQPDDRERVDIEHDGGGKPAAAVTLVARAELLVVRGVDWFIRLLRTGPRPARS